MPRDRASVDAVTAGTLAGLAQARPRTMGGFDHAQQLSQTLPAETARSFVGYDSDLRSVEISESEDEDVSDASSDSSAAPPPRPPSPAAAPPPRPPSSVELPWAAPPTAARPSLLLQDPDPGRRRPKSTHRPARAAAAPAAQGMSMDEIKLLRTWFPLLHAMPDAMMVNTDLATLSAINQSMSHPAAPPPPTVHSLNLAEVAAQAAAAAAAHMGLAAGGHRDEDPGIVMARSLESLRDRPVQVPPGLDNRSDQLHPARFLGGTVCSAKKMWREAREQLGLEGLPALANYDMAAIGLGGCVTARAWKELHNPASSSLTVKLFSAANMSSSTGSTRKLSLADGDKSIHVGESLKEIADLGELQLAVRAMCRAAQFVQPWNQSFNAIDGFLQSSDWARSELSGRSNRAALLTDFINYVLGLNAHAWQQKEDFRSSGEIKVLWGEWFGSRPASLLTTADHDKKSSGAAAEQNKQGGKKNQNRSGRGGNSYDGRKSGGGFGKQNFNVPPPQLQSNNTSTQRELFCYKFNNGNCPNQAGTCALPSGTKLQHLCDAYNSNGDQCKQPHPRCQHR